MTQLISPTSRLHASWLQARDEWGRGVHQPGASLHGTEDLDDPRGFADWVERLLVGADPTADLPRGYVPATNLWLVEDDTYLGAIQLRHTLTPALLEVGGHVGYGIRPSARGRGLATWALGAVLSRAARLHLDEVLVTCDDTNVASDTVIERNGGVLEDLRGEPGEVLKRRYWVPVP